MASSTSGHDHGRISDSIRSNDVAGIQSTDNAFSSDLNFCRVSKLVACNAVSIPPRRLFGCHGSRRSGDDQSVIFTSSWRVLLPTIEVNGIFHCI